MKCELNFEGYFKSDITHSHLISYLYNVFVRLINELINELNEWMISSIICEMFGPVIKNY